ncbi:hypothetical protein A9K75_08660 [Campylobacter fetus subsp. testudinum]|uniref:hypothetical protein n=1 Tax=Campylobacter fetus TaxID=196 RepID=UPI000818B02C|nr:hypothetical protein [Campylobacter fetus]OCR99073.1 hypothetical protein A9K75_08660 [Campylobacter fetus subsp. testudinum]
MKKLLFSVALSAIVSLGAYASDKDLLSIATGGAVSDKTAGVKVLSMNEMEQIKGGYYFSRASQYDGTGFYSSYAFVVSKNKPTDHDFVITNGGILVAKYRYSQSGKQYYLQVVRNGNVYSEYVGSARNSILNEFMTNY